MHGRRNGLEPRAAAHTDQRPTKIPAAICPHRLIGDGFVFTKVVMFQLSSLFLTMSVIGA
jgi:hypothetical protein